MKKLFFIIPTLMLLSGCTNVNIQTPDIIATNFPAYDFARQLTEDDSAIKMLIPPGSESHTYEPTPKDIIDIENSKLFIYTGGKSDSWIDEILKSIDTEKTTVLNLMDVCTPEFDRKGYDEHIWTSPKNAVKMTESIYDALCKIDAENKEIYKNNLDKYWERLYSLDNELSSLNTNSRLLIFADRFPFLHLAHDYNFDYISPFSGCSEHNEPSINDVNKVIDAVIDNNADTIFHIEFSNQELADTVCEATGAKKALLHSCHNVTVDEFNSGITYYELMNKNINTLREALN